MNQSNLKLLKNAPAWFSLKNYLGAKELSSYGWYIHLIRRWAALDCLERGYRYELSHFFTQPILSESEINLIKSKMTSGRNTQQVPKIAKVNLFTDTVRSLGLYWIAYGENDDLDVVKAIANLTNGNETDNDNELLSTSYDLYLKEKKGISNDGLLLLEIDSTATDEKILEDFATWLKLARDEFGSIKKKAFTEATFSEWCDYGVLPYLDLKIWSKKNCIKLTHYAIGKALYPDDDESCNDPTERVRRTTAPKADWLMNSAVLRALEIQAESDKKATLKI